MNFELTEDQNLLLTSFEGLLQGFRDPPVGEHGYFVYSSALQNELAASGFLEVAGESGFGLLEAALLTEAAARCAVSVEVAASTMIGPLLKDGQAPIALAWDLGKPVRYLQEAKTVCLLQDDGSVLVGTPGPNDRESIESVVAYPLGRLTVIPSNAVHYTGEIAAAIRRRALIGIAAEAAGLMRGALDTTVQYVKDRRQFGQPLGNFQAIQHRLGECVQLVEGCRLLALRAAYEDADTSAALACLYAQQVMRKVIYDCHQFTGAMGLTLEYPLHLWTYRLKFLQGEAGGRGEQARQVAASRWTGSSAPVVSDRSAAAPVELTAAGAR